MRKSRDLLIQGSKSASLSFVRMQCHTGDLQLLQQQVKEVTSFAHANKYHSRSDLQLLKIGQEVVEVDFFDFGRNEDVLLAQLLHSLQALIGLQ